MAATWQQGGVEVVVRVQPRRCQSSDDRKVDGNGVSGMTGDLLIWALIVLDVTSVCLQTWRMIGG